MSDEKPHAVGPLSMERDGEANPAGHFVRGESGDAPLSTNRRFNDSA